MVANSLLEIYTVIFSWNLYQAVWDVLVGTGIALVPFIAAIIANFKDAYEKGAGTVSGGVRSAIRAMEVSLISMILVMVLCVMPWTGFGMQVSTVKYDISIPDCNLNTYNRPATTGDGNNTGTNYDSTFPEADGLNVYRPVGWSFVELVSTALTHSTIESIQCVNNYEYMLMRIGAVTLRDEALKARVQDFYNFCYKPALRLYNADPNAPVVGGITPEVMDVDWIGSRVLQSTNNRYYRDPSLYMRDMEQYDFTRQAAFRDSDAAREFGANPSCHEVWLGEEGPGVAQRAPGLRDLLLAAIPSDDSGSIYQAWMDWGSEVLTVGAVDDPTKEDLLLKMILQADQANMQNLNIDMSGDVDAAHDFWDQLFDTVMKAGTAYLSLGEFFQANAMKQILKTTGPMIISMIQFVIILAAPFVMVLSSYRFGTFTALAMTYFGFEFINAIWAFAFWFDQKLLDLFLSRAGYPDVLDATIISGVLSATNALLLPMVWLAIYGYAATGMVRGMGYGSVGGGTAMGGSGAAAAGKKAQAWAGKGLRSAGSGAASVGRAAGGALRR